MLEFWGMKFRVPKGYVLIKESEYRALLERLDSLEAQLQQVNDRIKELDARLKKDSNNSSKQPVFLSFPSMNRNKEKSPLPPIVIGAIAIGVANGDTLKELLVRSKYLLYKFEEEWTLIKLNG